jgi:hypothetical protein
MGDRLVIIDKGVFSEKDSCALSKADFASYVSNDVPNFDNFDFTEFKKIFDVFQEIIADQPLSS